MQSSYQFPALSTTGIFKIGENLYYLSKAVANRQWYNQQTNTKQRSLNVYVTLTFHRHKTQSAKCSIATHIYSQFPT